LFLHCEKKTSFNLLPNEKTDTRYIKPIWLKLNCVFGRLLKWNWIKLDGLLVLFKKISRKVNVICPFIINVIFIVNVFSILSMHITLQFALTYDLCFDIQPVRSTGPCFEGEKNTRRGVELCFLFLLLKLKLLIRSW